MVNIRTLSLIGILLSISFSILAQTPTPPIPQPPVPSESEDAKAVRAVVYQMFDAMRKGDSSMLRPLFAEDIISASAFKKDGKSMMRGGDMERFITAVGTPHEKVWDEKIWNIRIHVDANMATAWMNYAFFLGDKFSHCGVNNFVLFKSDEGWKVVHLMDTRRSEGCPLPPTYEYPSGG